MVELRPKKMTGIQHKFTYDDKKLEKKNKSFGDTLKSDEFTRTPEHQVIVKKFWADLQEKKTIPTIFGAFGPETENSDAYLEEVIKPEWGGTFLKLYGCSYLYRGYPDKVRTDGLQLAKGMLLEFAEEIISKSYIYITAIVLKAIIFRKRFIHDLDKFAWLLTVKSLSHYDIPPKEYGQFAREVKRAAYISIQKTFNIENPAANMPPREAKYRDDQLGYLLWRSVRFLLLFLDTDNAYRLPIQDAFTEPDFWTCFNRLLKRFHYRIYEDGMGYGSMERKLKFIKIALKTAFLIEPRLKEFVDTLILELDYSKIAMDEADWYFSLRFKSYDFKDMSFDEREAEWQRINKAKNHIFLI